MTTPTDRPRRQRREPCYTHRSVALDARGEALSELLTQVFADFDVQIAAPWTK